MAALLTDAEIVALHEAGSSTRDIAAIEGIRHHSTIARRLKHLTPRQSTEIYKTHRANILAEMQRKISMVCDLRALRPPKTMRDLSDAAKSLSILHQMEQIERGNTPASRPLIQINIGGHPISVSGGLGQPIAQDADVIDVDRADSRVD